MTHPDEMNDYARPLGVLPSDLLRTDTTHVATNAELRSARAADVRNAAHAAWRDSYDHDRTTGEWSAPMIITQLQVVDDVQDTLALRVLANRVAASAGRPARMHEPRSALVNIARTAAAMAVGANDIVLGKIRAADATDETDSTLDELAEVVRDLVAASERLEQLARRTFP